MLGEAIFGTKNRHHGTVVDLPYLVGVLAEQASNLAVSGLPLLTSPIIAYPVAFHQRQKQGASPQASCIEGLTSGTMIADYLEKSAQTLEKKQLTKLDVMLLIRPGQVPLFLYA